VLKDRTKPFPVGSDNATGILKWRLAVTDEDMVPLSVNFWPSSESGRSVVSVEYSVKDDFLGRDPEMPFVMRNLCFALPCPYVSCGWVESALRWGHVFRLRTQCPHMRVLVISMLKFYGRPEESLTSRFECVS
jgi:hypothetical protein